MPRIEEYLPETEGAGPVGGLDPKTEAVGRVGAGIEKLGQSLHEAGSVFYRQQEQEEVSDAKVSLAQKNVDYQARIQQETQDGSLDINQLKQDYQNEIQKESQEFSTAGGRNFFNGVSARMGARLTIQAMHGQSQIAAVKAANNWETTQRLQENGIRQDPSTFDSTMQDAKDGIQAMADADTGPERLTAKAAPRLLADSGRRNAYAAVEGYANLRGDSRYTNEDGDLIDGPDIARQILDSGKLDVYLKDKDKEALYRYADRKDKDNEAEDARSERDDKDTQAANDEEVRKNFVPLLLANKLTPDMVTKLSDPDEQYKWVQRIEAHGRDKFEKSDPAVQNEIYRRINLPDGDDDKIRTRDQLMEYLGHGATPGDVDRISGLLNKSRAGEVLRDNRKRVLDLATSKLVKKDVYGNADPDGQENMLNFTIALQHAEDQKLQNNESPLSLYDPNSKDYFGNELPKYQLTPMQVIKKKAGAMRSQTGGGQQPPSHPDIVTKDRKTLTWSEADKGYVEK